MDGNASPLTSFNLAPGPELRGRLRSCCTAEAWSREIIEARPYRSADVLYATSDRATATLDAAGLEQALAGHPRIGELATARAGGGPGAAGGRPDRAAAPRARGKPSHTATPPACDPPQAAAELTRGEQAGVAGADTTLLAELAEANAAYEARFGHVYLVCATGRSAGELLTLCRARLTNDALVERRVVLGELAKINRLRLAKLLEGAL